MNQPLVIWITGAAAVVLALGVLWTKALRPGARLISQAERTVPVMQALVDTFGRDTVVFSVLNEIAAEFRTNSGSTLRDVVDRLEARLIEQDARDFKLEADLASATREALDVADKLRINVEAARLLSEADRRRMGELLVLLGRVSATVDVSQAIGQATADDLAASHARADDHVDADPGSAADAFSKQEPTARE